MLPPRLMQLYTATAAGPSRAVWLFLLENEIRFELKKVFAQEPTQSDSGQKSRERAESEWKGWHISTASNSVMGAVGVSDWSKFGESSLPMLKDRGTQLWECNTILRYLCRTQDTSSDWYPSDTKIRAAVDMYLDWHHQLLRATLHVLELTTGCNPALPPSDKRRSVDIESVAMAMKRYIQCLTVIDTQFLGHERPFISGNQIAICDLVCATEISFYKAVDADLSPFPRLCAWFERVKAKLNFWDDINVDFNQFVTNCMERRRKKEVRQQKIMKHGKDAAGGNRAPDVSHTVYFQQQPSGVWKLLTDTEGLCKSTNSHCAFSTKSGGRFDYYNKTVEGSNLYVEDSKRLLQSWRNNDWPKNAFSTVRINLEKSESGTQLILTQSDVPPNFIKKTDVFWDEKFWRPLGGVLVRNILQQVFFDNLSPHDVYLYLTDSQKCTKLTGKKCDISRGVGGEVFYLDGQISGKNTQLITDLKICQQWRCADWPTGHSSSLTLDIKRVAGGTSVIHSQVNVPVHNYRAVCEVWDKYFWKRMMRDTATTRGRA